jgi:hypothetical protein
MVRRLITSMSGRSKGEEPGGGPLSEKARGGAEGGDGVEAVGMGEGNSSQEGGTTLFHDAMLPLSLQRRVCKIS